MCSEARRWAPYTSGLVLTKLKGKGVALRSAESESAKGVYGCCMVIGYTFLFLGVGGGRTMAFAILTAMWPRPPKPTTPVTHAAPMALAPKWASGE